MSEGTLDFKEAEIAQAVVDLTDWLIETGEIGIGEDGTAEFTSERLFDLSYRAICVGYGFSFDFLPPGGNTLLDDVYNVQYDFDRVLKEVDQDDDYFWKHKVDRRGLVTILRYWYEMGLEQTGMGFPYDECGVSAAEFMAMNEDEQQALMEAE